MNIKISLCKKINLLFSEKQFSYKNGRFCWINNQFLINNRLEYTTSSNKDFIIKIVKIVNTLNRMGYLSVTVVTSFVVYLAYYTIIFGNVALVEAKTDNAAPAVQPNNELPKLTNLWFKALPQRRFKSPYEYRPLPQPRENYQPLDIDNFDDSNDIEKKFDDYGHLRFGKRFGGDNFDDYGHMR